MEMFLTIIIIFVLFVWLMGKFFPLILQWYVKRKIKKMGGANYGYGVDPKQAKKKEGEVTVTGAQNKEKVIKDDVGEYIDFEENE
jgi:hypothetical protein